MIKKAYRVAATAAALAILVGLTVPLASHAAPVRNQDDVAAAERVGPADLWQSLADLWQGLMSAVFGASADGTGEDEPVQETTAGGPPEGGGGGGGNPSSETGDNSPGSDPDG